MGKNNNSEWMQKWQRIVNIDLKTERNINETFIIEFDPEWHFPPEFDDPFEGYFIYLHTDIIYRENLENYISVELTNNNVIFDEKFNIFEPIEKQNYSKVQLNDNINYKYIHGLFGVINLNFDETYQIKIDVYFDENIIEINEFRFTIEKRLL